MSEFVWKLKVFIQRQRRCRDNICVWRQKDGDGDRRVAESSGEGLQQHLYTNRTKDMQEIFNLTWEGNTTLLLLSMEHLAVQRGRHMAGHLHRQSEWWMGWAVSLMVDNGGLQNISGAPSPMEGRYLSMWFIRAWDCWGHMAEPTAINRWVQGFSCIEKFLAPPQRGFSQCQRKTTSAKMIRIENKFKFNSNLSNCQTSRT